MYINSFSPQYLNFCSLKPQMITAENAVKEVRREIGSIKSGSKMRILANKRANRYGDTDLTTKLKYKATKLQSEIYNDEYKNITKGIYKSLEDLSKEFLNRIKRNNGKANCYETNLILMDKLEKKGLDPKMFQLLPQPRFDTVSNQTSSGSNHFSLVIGLNKTADITKPHTWGSSAIIVDAWANIVMKADDGLKYLKEICTTSGCCGYIIENYNPRMRLKISEKNPPAPLHIS